MNKLAINQAAIKDIRVIITGTTGMVGEGVLHECLQHPGVTAVLVVNRRPCGITHPKLKEVLHADFFDISGIEFHLKGYNACYFCLGVSVIGMKKEDYFQMTYTLTTRFAATLSRLNPEMIFCYVSGSGTDTSEKGRSRWARVKGQTENELMKMTFRKVFAFRPGFMKPTKGLRNAKPFYKYINWMYPVGRALFPNGFCTLRELGLAMINVAGLEENRAIIDGKAIIRLAAV